MYWIALIIAVLAVSFAIIAFVRWQRFSRVYDSRVNLLRATLQQRRKFLVQRRKFLVLWSELLSAWSHQTLWIGLAIATAVLSITLLLMGIDKGQTADGKEPRVVSAPVLEQILQDRLPVPATIEERHEQILQALKKSSLTSPASGVSPANGRIGLTQFGFGLITAFFLVTLFVVSIDQKQRIKWVVGGVTLLGSLGVIDHFAGFGFFEKFEGEIFAFHLEGNGKPEPTDVRLSLELGDGGVNIDCPTEYQIGPFADALSSQLEKKSLNDEVSRVRDDVKNKRQQRRLAALIFVGSSDKRALHGSVAQSYGSNAGLAQARAISVKAVLEKQLQSQLPTVLVFSTGPSVSISRQNMDREQFRQALAPDRHVQICAVWGSY